MKELTALDIHYLVKEFQTIIDSKVDQIYQPGELLIRIHNSKTGKKIFRISKNFIFLTDFKGEQPQNPKTFCTVLRKHIGNARIRGIEQVGFERIIKFSLEKKNKFNLYVELFAKGNIILTNENNKIVNLLKVNKRKNVLIGNIYEPPLRDVNFLTLKESEFKKIIKNSEETLVKCLAKEIGLGGIYAEYVLEGINKEQKASELKLKDLSNLFYNLSKLKDKKIKVSMYKKRPIPFEAEQPLNYSSFNEALSEILIEELKKEEEERKNAPYLNKKSKIEKIIKVQKENLSKQEQEIKLNSEKAEMIYQHYKEIDDILKQLEIAKKTITWKELKEKLKGHKLIKKVNEKNGTIEVEL